MKIIALTSCPVGMAHTYMSAAALKKFAKKNETLNEGWKHLSLTTILDI